MDAIIGQAIKCTGKCFYKCYKAISKKRRQRYLKNLFELYRNNPTPPTEVSLKDSGMYRIWDSLITIQSKIPSRGQNIECINCLDRAVERAKTSLINEVFDGKFLADIRDAVVGTYVPCAHHLAGADDYGQEIVKIEQKIIEEMKNLDVEFPNTFKNAFLKITKFDLNGTTEEDLLYRRAKCFGKYMAYGYVQKYWKELKDIDPSDSRYLTEPPPTGCEMDIFPRLLIEKRKVSKPDTILIARKI